MMEVEDGNTDKMKWNFQSQEELKKMKNSSTIKGATGSQLGRWKVPGARALDYGQPWPHSS